MNAREIFSLASMLTALVRRLYFRASTPIYRITLAMDVGIAGLVLGLDVATF